MLWEDITQICGVVVVLDYPQCQSIRRLFEQSCGILVCSLGSALVRVRIAELLVPSERLGYRWCLTRYMSISYIFFVHA
jgi:hypothetical protein